MYESRPGIELYYFYDSYGNLTSIRYLEEGATTEYSYYVTTNIQGDVLGIYTSQGIQVAAYEYDAWGNCTVYDVTQDSAGNNVFTEVTYSDSQKFNMEFLNPFRYRGYYYDQDMGLYYLQSRYYDPQVGRFISADSYVSTGQGILGYNMFAYCNNNPVIYNDKSGTSISFALIFLVVCVVAGGVLGATSNEKLWKTAETNKKNRKDAETKQKNRKDTETRNKKSNNTNGKPLPESNNEPITIGDRAINALIGASIGLGVGGAVLSIAGAIGVVVTGSATTVITVFGASGAQTFAYGALALNSFVMFFLPCFGIELEPIEYAAK